MRDRNAPRLGFAPLSFPSGTAMCKERTTPRPLHRPQNKARGCAGGRLCAQRAAASPTGGTHRTAPLPLPGSPLPLPGSPQLALAGESGGCCPLLQRLGPPREGRIRSQRGWGQQGGSCERRAGLVRTGSSSPAECSMPVQLAQPGRLVCRLHAIQLTC